MTVGSLVRIWLVTATLLRGKRVLLVLLMLWPCVLSGILLAADRGRPSVDDAAAVLQQELLYGLILAGLGASTALGTEQRARRTQQVLGRAVGRSEYLASLGLSAYLPFAGYVVVWMANAGLVASLLGLHPSALLETVAAALVAGVLLCVCGLLFSVLVPALVAAGCTGAVLALLLGLHGTSGLVRLFHTAAGLDTAGASAGDLWGGAASALGLATLLFAVAAAHFRRRDLELS